MSNKWLYLAGLVVVGFLAFYFYQKYKIAPDLEITKLQLSNLKGERVSLSDLDGKKTILCFGASWCGPCRAELKMISAVKNTLLHDVDVIVISDEDIDKVILFKERTGFPFEWLKLTGPFKEIGINSIPTTYLVNTKGQVVKKTVGYIDWRDPGTVGHLSKLME